MPDANHPYMQVAERIRRRILDGALKEGEKLPPVRELAKSEGVSVATLGRSLDQLQVEGYITTSRRGTFVANAPEVAPSGYDRITRVLRTGSVLAEGETMIVTTAELIKPPQYVAEIFDLDDGDQVVRRQWHTGRGQQRTGLFVTWHPAHFAAAVPELLSTSRTSSPGLLLKIQQATGRQVTAGRDDIHGRDADAREAGFLGLRVGSPILAGVHRLWDDEGVIEYGEWCLPYRLAIGYEYSVEAAPDAS
ncbi:GntR family transcriptional regulator [Streptomyces roseirectus]|uniref:GntR family transcriptional regulator n=1 Tax=Streptomyces roseirectus TaxID=2768066 RepID=A0A7H0IGL9_9ACTN|nr:GntR family transcriptional regulator [Streptomyces roseirectus]QNP71935.1 GntR family transcriptional regulator [Streptomyces roseirectus]